MENYPKEMSIIVPVLDEDDRFYPESITEELGFSVTRGVVPSVNLAPIPYHGKECFASILGAVEPQDDGGFVAFSNDYPGAVGQGETDEEAYRDLLEAIKLLKEVLEESD